MERQHRSVIPIDPYLFEWLGRERQEQIIEIPEMETRRRT